MSGFEKESMNLHDLLADQEDTILLLKRQLEECYSYCESCESRREGLPHCVMDYLDSIWK